MNKKLYLFELDDYSAPSCTSSTKTYFGTVDDFKKLTNGLDKENYEEMLTAFDKFLQGDVKVQHTVCYNPHRLAIPAKVIKEREIELKNFTFQYQNPYGFYYICKGEDAKIALYLIKSQRKYYCGYRMSVKNPKFCDDLDKREIFVEPPFWGFPNMLLMSREEQARYFENILIETEKELGNEEEAIDYFENLKEINMTGFFEEIFGDG